MDRRKAADRDRRARIRRGARFTGRPQPKWLATASDVVGAINKPGVKIIDARTAAEIEGKELRNIKRGGFVPSSIPVYWEDLLDPQTENVPAGRGAEEDLRGPRHRAGCRK